MIISFISSTIQDFISKDYDSGFNNLMIVLLFIEVLLLLWSRADAEKLIDLQDEIIDSQDTTIKQNEKSIELQDEIIDKQSKWINQVTKTVKEPAEKFGGRTMLKKYSKTVTIKAEQFDGSEEMIKKYGIIKEAFVIDDWGTTDDYQYCLKTREGRLVVNIGDWIATGVEGEYWAIADEIFKKTYEEVE